MPYVCKVIKGEREKKREEGSERLTLYGLQYDIGRRETRVYDSQ